MHEAFVPFLQALKSRKVELTPEEMNVLNECTYHARKNLAVGCAGGAIVSWLATMRLRSNYVPQIGLSIVATVISGCWNMLRCVEGNAERILSLEGSHIQKELATIMLNKYGHNPRRLQRFSKFFFREEVFVDTSADKPMFRWRLGNTYGDPIVQCNDTYGEETDLKKNDVKKSTAEHNQVNVNDANAMVVDPFNAMFETPENVENIPDSNATGTSHQRSTYSGRHHRRRRRHHQEETDV